MSSTKPAYENWQNNTHPCWWKDPSLRRCVTSIGVLYLCVWSFGYDGSLLNGLQTMPLFQEFFDHPTGNRLGLISAVFYFPKLVVGFIASFLAERFGRRVPLTVGCVVLIGGAILCGFAQNEGHLIGGRALVGTGTGFMATVAPPLLAEFAHPRLRSISGGMFLCTYYLGTTTSAWLCYGLLNVNNDWGWRVASLVQCTGAIIVLIYILLGRMPESPRYLFSVGKEDQALKLLAALHSNGLEDDELVRNEFEEIKQGFRRNAELPHTGYTAFLKTAGNRKRLLLIICCAAFAQINGVGLVSYYLAPILRLVGVVEPLQQAGINGGLAIFNLVVSLIAAQFVDRWGRRPLWLASSAGTLVAFIFVAGLSASIASGPQLIVWLWLTSPQGAFDSTGNQATGTAVIPFLFVFYGFYDIGYTVLPNLYVPEILPYHLRTKGMSIYIFSQAVVVSFNQWVNPVALDAIAWRYYLVYVGVQIIILGVVYWSFLETKGYTIEEVSSLLDGPDARVTAEGETNDIVADSEDKKEGLDVVHDEQVHASKRA